MENEQQDFVLEMSEYIPVEVSKKKVYSLKDVKVKYRCEHTGDWVDMLINEDDLKVIHNPINSIGKSLYFGSGTTKGGDYIVDDDWMKYVEQMRVDLDNQITGAGLRFISWDEGVGVTNDLNSLTKEKDSKPKERQIENNAWNGGKNKRFSGYKSYY